MSTSLGSAVLELSTDDKGLSRGLKKAEGRMAGFAQSAKKVGTVLTGIGAAGALLIGKTVSSFSGFELALTKAGAVAGATSEQMGTMSDVARELGRTTAFSAKQAAEALTFLSMAGFSVKDSTAALPGVLQLAAAANLDLGQSADIASNVLAGFGLEVEDLGRVNDVMTKAFTSANTDLTQLAQALKFAGPVAAAAGIGFEETTAALALMGNAGIQASMAGTGLRGAMTRLLNPTGAIAKTINRLGVELTDTEGNLLPLVDIVREFERVGLSAGDAMVIFGQRAGPAMLALLSQGSGALEKLTTDLENSGGTAKRIADAQMATFHGSMLKLKSAVEGLQITMGKALAPTIKALAGIFTAFTSTLANLNPTVVKIAAVLIGLTTAMALIAGPLLLLIGFLPAMASGLAIVSVAFGGLTLAMGPVTIAILAIGAAIAAGILIWKNWDKIVNVVKATWTVISKKIEGIFKSKWAWLLPGGPLIKAIIAIKKNWKSIWDFVSRVFSTVSDTVSRAFASKWGWLLPGGPLVKAILWIRDNWTKIWQGVASDFQRISDVMSKALRPLRSIMGDVRQEMIKLEAAAVTYIATADDIQQEVGDTTAIFKDQIPIIKLDIQALEEAAAANKELADAELEARLEAIEFMNEVTRLSEENRKGRVAAQEFADGLQRMANIVGIGAQVMQLYRDKVIGAELAQRLLQDAIDKTTEEARRQADAFQRGLTAIEANREAWERWEFQNSSINRALQESGASWQDMLNAIARSTGRNIGSIKEELIEAGVRINDIQALIKRFGGTWVEQFTRMGMETEKARQDRLESARQGLANPAIALAHGAIVTSPTLAMIGERGPEAIIPLDRLGSTGVTNQYFIENLFGVDDLEDFVTQANLNQDRRGGIPQFQVG